MKESNTKNPAGAELPRCEVCGALVCEHLFTDENGELVEAGKNPAAVKLGKLGGAAKSEAKTAAARENGKKGGRPVKCHRIGCQNKATEKYEDKKSLCWLDPVCYYHQFHA